MRSSKQDIYIALISEPYNLRDMQIPIKTKLTILIKTLNEEYVQGTI